jgi:surface protein
MSMKPYFLPLFFTLLAVSAVQASKLQNYSNNEVSRPFITIWQTDNEGLSNDNQIIIPGVGNGYLISWEEVDNPENSGTETGMDEQPVTLPSSGTYKISITGNLTRIHFNNEGDKDKILEIKQWGDIAWSSMERAFFGATNLDISATDAPDLSGVTSMAEMFRGAESMNAEIGHWNTENITNMSGLFQGPTIFDQDIGSWDTGNVTDMSKMFKNAYVEVVTGKTEVGWPIHSIVGGFNQDISNWDTGNVRDMSEMFRNARVFNQNISG